MKLRNMTDLVRLARHFNGLTPAQIHKLFRLEGQLSRLAVAQCNREFTAKDHARVKRLQGVVREIFKEAGVHATFEFNRDPRGVAFKVNPEDRNGNCFGGGWAFTF